MKFSTKRLIFAQIEKEDEDVFKRVYSDPEAATYVGDGTPISEEDCKLWIKVTQRNYETRGYGMLKILEQSTGEVVGCCGVVHPGNQEAPEIKYCFIKEHWGKGFATEAVTALISHFKTEHGVADFVATVHPANIASQRVLAKSLFKQGETLSDEDGSETLVFYFGDQSIQEKI